MVRPRLITHYFTCGGNISLTLDIKAISWTQENVQYVFFSNNFNLVSNNIIIINRDES